MTATIEIDASECPFCGLACYQRLGLFLVLAGALASALRRYTVASGPGTLAISGLCVPA